MKKVLFATAVFVMLLSGISLAMNCLEVNRSSQEKEVFREVADQKKGSIFLKERWHALHNDNHDMIAFLSFDSGLISLPVMKGSEYLQLGFDRTQQLGGLPYIESDTSFDDQLVVIYGHSVFYPGNDLVFTALNSLHEQSEFEKNRTFRICLEDRIMTYEIVAVDLTDPYREFHGFDIPYFKDENTYTAWHACVEAFNSVRSDTPYDKNSEFVVMQTCYGYHSPEVTLVIAKKVTTEKYD